MSVKKYLVPFALSSIAILLGSTEQASAQPSVYPHGVTVYNPAKAYNSYVLFGAPDGKARLIDMSGKVVHDWSKAGFPTEMIDPAIAGGEKGRIMVQLENQPAPFGGMFSNVEIGDMNWEGKTVWRWGKDTPEKRARQNHDWARLANGNTLVITTVDHVVPIIGEKNIADQTIREITKDGKEVWSWNAGEHFDEFGISQEGLELIRKIHGNGSKGSGWLVINDMQPIGPNKWFDAGDQRFNPDNIMIDSREASFVAIIEKKTGKIVWRMGPDYAVVNQSTSGTATISTAQIRPVLKHDLPRPVDQTSGQHDAHIIPEGLPGAGNLLVFDNEGASGFPATRIPVLQGSRVLEINPQTKEIVWQYSGADSGSPVWSFFSSFISSARRLPNGNTLIDEGMNGRMFQVTPKGEIVWEYINPFYAQQTFTDEREINTNWVFRAQPVPYNWVPAGTPHSEKGIKAVDNTKFRVPQ